jgi:hypothetical protein
LAAIEFTPERVCFCHGRACPGHPRFAVELNEEKTWMPATQAFEKRRSSNGYARA